MDYINITKPKITCEKCGKIEGSKVKCYISQIGWKSYILCSECVENIINYIDNTKKFTVEELKDIQNSIKLDETIDAIEVIKNQLENDYVDVGGPAYSNEVKVIRQSIDMFMTNLDKEDETEKEMEYSIASVASNKVFPKVFATNEEAIIFMSQMNNPSNWKVVSREVTRSEWK